MLIIGLSIGFVIGFIFAAWASVESDKQAVADGVIKLCGDIYKIEEIDV